MLKQIPKILYKYKKCDDGAREMLKNNQVRFTNPLLFNDPFDCAALDLKSALDNFREEQIIKLASLKFRTPLQMLTEEDIQLVRNEAPEMAESNAAIEEYVNYVSTDMGILALSACNNSILMWSHYADFHRGFCIGFLTNSEDFPQEAIKKVIYSEPRKMDFMEQFRQSFQSHRAEKLSGEQLEKQFYEKLTEQTILTKYIDWKYEQEWRVIAKQGVGTYSDTSIANIIFGLKMPKEDRETIRATLKGKKVDFFEAVKSEKEFAIELRQIDN